MEFSIEFEKREHCCQSSEDESQMRGDKFLGEVGKIRERLEYSSQIMKD